MAIASAGFFPFGNDMTASGEAIKVSLEHAGRMLPAATDTHWRVHEDNNTFHCPKIPWNRSRKKGELCCHPMMEVTGSSNGMAKKPKLTPLKHCQEKETPALVDIAREHFTTHNGETLIQCQIDGTVRIKMKGSF